MSYNDLVKRHYTRIKNDDGVMWASVESVSDMLEEVKKSHPSLYWAFMRDQHEILCGKHFDREYAEWEVERMHHKNTDGTMSKGEHWTFEQTTEVFNKHRGRIPAEYTEADFYVALNAQWHDTYRVASSHFGSDDEVAAYIIDETIDVWFNDDDWPGHDKVWRYFRAKNE